MLIYRKAKKGSKEVPASLEAVVIHQRETPAKYLSATNSSRWGTVRPSSSGEACRMSLFPRHPFLIKMDRTVKSDVHRLNLHIPTHDLVTSLCKRLRKHNRDFFSFNAKTCSSCRLKQNCKDHTALVCHPEFHKL